MRAAVVVTTAFAARLAFWQASGWTLEDGLIVARMARNFAEHGELSFNLGWRVSSATSPLFGLTAGLLAELGIEPVAATKILGLVAGTATCWVLLRLLDELVAPGTALGGALVYSFLPPAVAYSVAGLETPVYTLLIAASFLQLVRRRGPAALAWALGAALVRPEGLLLVVVVALAVRRSASPLRLLRSAAPVAVLGLAAVALHWFYYGTPLPTSVVAKAAAYDPDVASNAVRYIERMLLAQPAGLVLYLFAAVGVVADWRGRRRLVAPTIWYLAYHAVLILRAPLFSWYLQPAVVVLIWLAVVGIAETAGWIARRVSAPERDRALAGGISFLLAAAMLVASIPYTRNRERQQRYEESVRAAAGRWIDRHAPPEALVFTESLGHIGYAMENPIVDWPGIAAPGVPPLLRSLGAESSRWEGYRAIVAAYEPRYLALREEEWDGALGELRDRYTPCVRFDADRSLGSSYGPPYVVAADDPSACGTSP